MSFVNFENRTKFMWNVAFNYIMKIKDDYIEAFGELDTFSIKEMCERLNTPEYNNFLLCVDIKKQGSLNLFCYSFTKGGELDMFSNQNSIYREMRGVVIDVENEELVLVPFRKFFNIDQTEEVSWKVFNQQLKNAKSVEITNKLDGSMVSCAYYSGQYMMAGTGSILGGGNFRLNEAHSWLTKNYKDMIKKYPEITFIFEYISLKDKHIVEYSEKEQGLYLVGARNIYTGEEWSYSRIQKVAKEYNVRMVKIEDATFNEIKKQTGKFNSSEKEGWVIYVDGFKYKFKCDDYVKIHEILDKRSSKNKLIRAIADGTIDDIIAKIPSAFKKDVLADVEVINNYIKKQMEEIYSNYNKVKDIESDKEVALTCKKMKMSNKMMGYIFSIRNSKEINILKNNYGKYLKAVDIFEKDYYDED